MGFVDVIDECLWEMAVHKQKTATSKATTSPVFSKDAFFFKNMCVGVHKVIQVIWKSTESKQLVIRRQPQQSQHCCRNVRISWSQAETKANRNSFPSGSVIFCTVHFAVNVFQLFINLFKTLTWCIQQNTECKASSALLLHDDCCEESQSKDIVNFAFKFYRQRKCR